MATKTKTAKRKMAVTSKDARIIALADSDSADKRTLAVWAADCAERTLHYFQEKRPRDERPRNAISALRAWVRTGVFKMVDVRKASLDAHAAAREVESDDAARSAARAAGQAMATAHARRHSIAAAIYAATAVRDAVNSSNSVSLKAAADAATLKERNWQYEHLLGLIEKSAQKSSSAASAAWERAYSKKRIAWRGTTNFAPSLPKGSRVLEIGCGNGKNLSALIGKGYDVHAIDYSPQAIALCKESPSFKNRKESKIKFSVMDARELDFKDGFFDAVVCFHVLGNMMKPDRIKAANEASRVLKKGGKLFFKEFGAGDFRFGKGLRVEKNSFKRRTGIVTHYFEGRSEVAALFNGLDLDEFESERWTVHYSGLALPREEVHAVFIKR